MGRVDFLSRHGAPGQCLEELEDVVGLRSWNCCPHHPWQKNRFMADFWIKRKTSQPSAFTKRVSAPPSYSNLRLELWALILHPCKVFDCCSFCCRKDLRLEFLLPPHFTLDFYIFYSPFKSATISSLCPADTDIQPCSTKSNLSMKNAFCWREPHWEAYGMLKLGLTYWIIEKNLTCFAFLQHLL